VAIKGEGTGATNDARPAATTQAAPGTTAGGRWGWRLSAYDMHLLGVVLIWGFNYVTMKWALREVGVGPLTLVRYALAAPLMALAAWAMRERFRVERRDIPRFIWVGLVGITFYPLVFGAAVQYSTAANVALLLALSPVFTGLFEILAGRQRLTRRFALGASHVMSYMYLIPAAAAAAGALVLAEPIYPQQAGGAVVALFGVYLVRTGVTLRRPAATQAVAQPERGR
jgi:drug/metabolite transporter (DMT)-like permease